MELNWSTFLLEIINFLVLVWILKRFLFRPVQAVIAERRRAVQDQLARAREDKDAADTLKTQYEGRLESWEAEKREARQQLAREIDEERSRRLAAVNAEVEREREKARVTDERRLTETRRSFERRALQQGAAFASRLLQRAAGPELEDSLLCLLVEELQGLSDERRARLLEQWPEAPGVVEVSSAFELSGDQRQRLAGVLEELSGSASASFRRDASLIAGVRLEIGAWVLAATVADELRAFAELAGESR